MNHRWRKRVARAVALAGAAGCVAAAAAATFIVPGSAQADGPDVSARLMNAAGEQVGTATLTQETSTVGVKVLVRGLAPGFHGIHVHEVGACKPDFAAAGGHFNPVNPDGTSNNHGHHAGDLPSLLVNPGGTGELRFTTSAFTIRALRENLTGTALIIHAAPDNYANIPTARYFHLSGDSQVAGPDARTLDTGDAGERVACGVLTAPTTAP